MSDTDFHETQRISMWWVWVAALAPAVVMALLFFQGIVCDRPQEEYPVPTWLLWSISIFICICVPALLWLLRLTVRVSDDGVHVRYYPFVNRKIPLADIRAFRARRYRPIREFGGWGIRTGLGNKSAYNAKGDLGVELYLNDMRSIMLGSQRPDELAAALRQHGLSEEPAP